MHPALGHRIAPPRFLLFVGVTLAATLVAWGALPPRFAIMAGFDVGAAVFLLVCLPLLRHESADMRQSAKRNDANRAMLLLVTGAVSIGILAAIVSEMRDKADAGPGTLALILGTLALCWTFSNTIYALHYAHLFYSEGKEGDLGGLEFPETKEPDYWDFLYFAFCLGMTFQTSDVTVTQGRVRKPVTLHCLAAFVFNLGILAFTINVLGGS